jgi:putative phosphoribosyl transferase
MPQREDEFGQYEAASYRHWIFRDRADGAAQLARKLSPYKHDRPLVLGLACGGIPVALELARRLGAEVDALVARKLPAPGQPGLAIGAVTADGTLWFNRDRIVQLGVSDSTLDDSVRTETAAAKRQAQRFGRDGPGLDPSGRVVIVADDGLATGASLRVAAQSLRERATRLVAAVPIGTPAGLAAIADQFDEVVCLHCPEPFLHVGLHYRTFDELTDDAAADMLARYRKQRSATGAHPRI